VLCFHSLNFKKYHAALGCKEDIDAGKYPIAITIINCNIIAFTAPLVNNTKNRRPSRRTSSTNASWITPRVVCIFFTHTTRGSGGVENFVNQMGEYIGLPLTMVGSGLRVPAHCGV
jgi:hypothetical protein